MTEAQYIELKTLYPRRGLFPLEINKMFNLFMEVENWNPGCQTCPDNIRFVLDRMYGKVEEYERLKNEEAARLAKQKEEDEAGKAAATIEQSQPPIKKSRKK